MPHCVGNGRRGELAERALDVARGNVLSHRGETAVEPREVEELAARALGRGDGQIRLIEEDAQQPLVTLPGARPGPVLVH